MTIATLHTTDGKEFACHGSHETMFIYRHDTDTIKLEPLKDIPFGIGLLDELDESLFNNNSIKLNSKDMLILCTDGIIEAMNAKKQEFGEEKLMTLIKDNAHKQLDDIKDLIVKTIINYTNNEILDDFSLIIIQAN